MIFFFDAQGNLIRSLPSRVKQGSNKASRIWLFMPTGQGNIANIAFTLPNGDSTPQVIMNKVDDFAEITNGCACACDINGNVFSGWYYDAPKAITTYAGNALVQFFITTTDDEEIATASADFVIDKGVVPQEPPTQVDSYQELLDFLVEFTTNNTEFKDIVSQEIERISNTVESVASSNLENGLSENSVQLRNALNKVLGKNSVALGEGLSVSANNQVAVGKYNVEIPNALFVVGMGTADGKANALVVLDNGQVKLFSAPIEENDAVNKKYVDETVASELSRTYKPQGTITSQDGINGIALNKSTLGFVYNVSVAFVTNDSFVEGVGLYHPAGTNIAVVEENGTYKLDVLSGFVDLSNYYTIPQITELIAGLTALINSKQNAIEIIS